MLEYHQRMNIEKRKKNKIITAVQFNIKICPRKLKLIVENCEFNAYNANKIT